MKILITESQLKKILLEVEEGDPIKSGEKKPQHRKQKIIGTQITRIV